MSALESTSTGCWRASQPYAVKISPRKRLHSFLWEFLIHKPCPLTKFLSIHRLVEGSCLTRAARKATWSGLPKLWTHSWTLSRKTAPTQPALKSSLSHGCSLWYQCFSIRCVFEKLIVLLIMETRFGSIFADSGPEETNAGQHSHCENRQSKFSQIH